MEGQMACENRGNNHHAVSTNGKEGVFTCLEVNWTCAFLFIYERM